MKLWMSCKEVWFFAVRFVRGREQNCAATAAGQQHDSFHSTITEKSKIETRLFLDSLETTESK